MRTVHPNKLKNDDFEEKGFLSESTLKLQFGSRLQSTNDAFKVSIECEKLKKSLCPKRNDEKEKLIFSLLIRTLDIGQSCLINLLSKNYASSSILLRVMMEIAFNLECIFKYENFFLMHIMYSEKENEKLLKSYLDTQKAEIENILEVFGYSNNIDSIGKLKKALFQALKISNIREKAYETPDLINFFDSVYNFTSDFVHSNSKSIDYYYEKNENDMLVFSRSTKAMDSGAFVDICSETISMIWVRMFLIYSDYCNVSDENVFELKKLSKRFLKLAKIEKEASKQQ
jgi:hypothetical protein